jgi:hypothetical protein
MRQETRIKAEARRGLRAYPLLCSACGKPFASPDRWHVHFPVPDDFAVFQWVCHPCLATLRGIRGKLAPTRVLADNT